VVVFSVAAGTVDEYVDVYSVYLVVVSSVGYAVTTVLARTVEVIDTVERFAV